MADRLNATKRSVWGLVTSECWSISVSVHYMGNWKGKGRSDGTCRQIGVGVGGETIYYIDSKYLKTGTAVQIHNIGQSGQRW